MTTSVHSQQLADLFASNGLQAVVALHLADQLHADLAIWPYAIDLNSMERNQSLPSRSPTGERTLPNIFQRTHVLVLPSTLSAYDQAREIVLTNPWLRTGEPPTHLVIEVLPLAEMTSLFLASGVSFRIALAIAIQ